MVRDRPSDQRGLLYAVAPAVFVLVFEGFAWAISAMTDSNGPAIAAAYVLIVGAVGAILAPIEIVRSHQKDAVMWAAVSIGLSSLGLFFGFIFYLGALTANCGSGCFG